MMENSIVFDDVLGLEKSYGKGSRYFLSLHIFNDVANSQPPAMMCPILKISILRFN